MSLIDEIKREREKYGTSLDPKYVRRLEESLLAADELYRATSFLADNDPDDVVCDGGGTAIMVGLSGIRSALSAYRKATGGGE